MLKTESKKDEMVQLFIHNSITKLSAKEKFYIITLINKITKISPENISNIFNTSKSNIPFNLPKKATYSKHRNKYIVEFTKEYKPNTITNKIKYISIIKNKEITLNNKESEDEYLKIQFPLQRLSVASKSNAEFIRSIASILNIQNLIKKSHKPEPSKNRAYYKGIEKDLIRRIVSATKTLYDTGPKISQCPARWYKKNIDKNVRYKLSKDEYFYSLLRINFDDEDSDPTILLIIKETKHPGCIFIKVNSPNLFTIENSKEKQNIHVKIEKTDNKELSKLTIHLNSLPIFKTNIKVTLDKKEVSLNTIRNTSGVFSFDGHLTKNNKRINKKQANEIVSVINKKLGPIENYYLNKKGPLYLSLK
ncbi:hypothetical protein [Vibrio sp. FJH11]